MTGALLLVLFVWLLPPRTTILPGPSAFEPVIAIDPSRPERIIAGAQYGEGYNRGGLRFRLFRTNDGGAAWEGGEVALRPLEREPTMAADLSLAYGPRGELYLFGISGDTYRGPVPEAALALAVSEDSGRTISHRALLGEGVDHAPNRFSVSDKPWVEVDVHPGSPHRGSLYFVWTRVDVRKTESGYDIARELVLAYSRDEGRTTSSPIPIAGSGVGGQIGVRPDGVLDLVWLEEEGETGGRVMHAISRDGGRSFSERSAIADVSGTVEESLDLPALAGSPPSVCWARGPAREARGTRIECSRYSDGGGWTRPIAVSTRGAVMGYPSLAATDEAYWLLGYEADETIRVVLHCSRDGKSFAPIATLASRPLPSDGFCPRPGLPCRKDLAKLTPGDYVGLSAAPGCLAAAYVLPDEGEARLFLSTIDLASGCELQQGAEKFIGSLRERSVRRRGKSASGGVGAPSR